MIVFVAIRLVVVILVVLTSFTFPNLNIVLTLGGSILGTIMTIIVPVMFYNRAYSMSEKNLKYDKNNYGDDSHENEGLLKENNNDVEKTARLLYKDKNNDKRKCIKVTNYIVLISGCTLSAIGFINACQELFENPDLR